MYFYVNGCSLTMGACDGYNHSKETQNNISWAKQLEKEFDSVIINDALNSGSNERIVRTTIEHVKNNYNKKDELFIWICWSGSDRFEFFINNDLEKNILKQYPWAGKEFLYDGLILNVTQYWLNRFSSKIHKDDYLEHANRLIAQLPKTNEFIKFKFENSNYNLNQELFSNQIILLQSFLEKHNIKYGMSFAFENLNKDCLVNKNTFFDFNGNMMKLIDQNGFKKDPTRHFYPDGYEFYGQQIAKFIKENYSL
jgi:hypothetical protein